MLQLMTQFKTTKKWDIFLRYSLLKTNRRHIFCHTFQISCLENFSTNSHFKILNDMTTIFRNSASNFENFEIFHKISFSFCLYHVPLPFLEKKKKNHLTAPLHKSTHFLIIFFNKNVDQGFEITLNNQFFV